MASIPNSWLFQILSTNHDDLLKNWTEGILGGLGRRANISDEKITRQAGQFLALLAKACSESTDINS